MTYLDHAATTPVLPSALEAFVREASRLGNPSSLHSDGRRARAVLETSRERIAHALGAESAEVILTAGGCEADTLAVVGAARAARRADPGRTRAVTSAVEHHAVLESVHALADEGGEAVLVPVGADGVIDLAALEAEIAEHAARTGVVSVMWANNETGAIQPVAEVVELVRRHGGNAVAVHSDAVQAVGHVPVDFGASGLDALSLSGHKLGAPAGIGALLAQRTLPLAPVVLGSGQERGVRSGTVPVALATALAVAVEHAVATLEAERARLVPLRDELAAGVLALVPGARLNGPVGPAAGDGGGRLPGHVHLTFPGADVDALLFVLDAAGISASAGAACVAGVTQPSHVLLAAGDDERDARSVLRLTLGSTTTADDVARVLAVLPDAVERARSAGRVAARRG
ncbi:cysteine desulfurase NifS [Serinibacter arcticus]|uniref:cysteine desulfurase n=1 Tax=Serinibacter arcticus TaxID=1655435 RepID=A0A2U1ZYZ2_9MICO|nr:cysteine desulfurase family protein [Serinibacter arcticus]PWD52206.1 cysteine desulfurase NifS [Serinibacter arcticus]